jgi:hypothetical protein
LLCIERHGGSELADRRRIAARQCLRYREMQPGLLAEARDREAQRIRQAMQGKRPHLMVAFGGAGDVAVEAADLAEHEGGPDRARGLRVVGQRENRSEARRRFGRSVVDEIDGAGGVEADCSRQYRAFPERRIAARGLSHVEQGAGLRGRQPFDLGRLARLRDAIVGLIVIGGDFDCLEIIGRGDKATGLEGEAVDRRGAQRCGAIIEQPGWKERPAGERGRDADQRERADDDELRARHGGLPDRTTRSASSRSPARGGSVTARLRRAATSIPPHRDPVGRGRCRRRCDSCLAALPPAAEAHRRRCH